MHEPGSYRRPAQRCSVELQCPHCGRPLFVDAPDTEVSVSVCPHGDCQLVSFVWAEPFMGSLPIDGRPIHCGAVALADLVRPPPAKSTLELAPILVILGLFLVVPLWMWMAVWHESPVLRMFVLMMSAPALFIGVLALVASGFDVVDELRRSRRTNRRRRDALARARWLSSSERRDWIGA